MYKRQIIFFGKEITYHELNNAVSRFANALYNMGIRKGDVVALYLPNIPQFVIAYYGALKAGATITAVSPLLGKENFNSSLAIQKQKLL